MDYIDYSNEEILQSSILGLSCFIILLFTFEVFKVLYFFSFSSRIVFNAIIEYFNKIYPISIMIFFPFMIISSIYTFFIYGDYIRPYYKSYAFHFIKTFTSIYRGLIDNKDFDDKISRYTYKLIDISSIIGDENKVNGINGAKDQLIYKGEREYYSMTVNSIMSNLNIIDFYGSFSYIIYGIIFFIFVRIILTGVNLSLFILTYKKYLKNQIIEERKKEMEEER